MDISMWPKGLMVRVFLSLLLCTPAFSQQEYSEDGAEFIVDHLSSDTQNEEADPFEKLGIYEVAEQSLTIPRTLGADAELKATLYAPLLKGTKNELMPVVIMLPGFSTGQRGYKIYSQHLASHGFFVLGIDFPKSGIIYRARHDENAQQVLQTLDFLDDKRSPTYGKVDLNYIAAAGHSLGGKIAFYAASLDPRIKVILAMDPVNSGGAPCFITPKQCSAFPVAPNPKTGDIGRMDQVNSATLIFRAPRDLIFNPEVQFNAFHFWNGFKGEGLYLDFSSAKHLSFVRDDVVIKITKRTMLAWLSRHFRGDGDKMDRYLSPNSGYLSEEIDDDVLATVEVK